MLFSHIRQNEIEKLNFINNKINEEYIRSIAIFDSGSGGLITLKRILQNFNNTIPVDLIYFADLKNMPYGEKKIEDIKSYTDKINKFLEKNFSPSLIINACNTSISACYDELCENEEKKKINIMDPFLKKINLNDQKILILATKFSSNINIFKKILDKNLINHKNIDIKSCDNLAYYIELYLKSKDIKIKEKIKNSLHYYFDKNNNYDYLIYGCSHYPHIHDIFSEYIINENLKINNIIDPSQYLVDEIMEIINKNPLKNNINSSFKIKFIINNKEVDEDFNKIIHNKFPFEKEYIYIDI